MITRKNGETHRQYISRLKAYNENITENNRALRKLIEVDCKVNPKNGHTYQADARSLFLTMAIIEKFLRDGHVEEAKQMAQQQLLFLGFTEVDLYTDKLLQDGAYDNEQK
jgi:hypothetical protein